MDEEWISRRVRRSFSHLTFDRPVPDRPIARRWGPIRPLRLASVGVLAVVAVLAFYALFPRSVPVVYADWVPQPVVADAATIARTASACGAADPAANGLPAIMVERRGSTAFGLFSDGVQAVDCLAAWDQSGALLDATAATTRMARPAGDLELVTVGRGTAQPTEVVGRVGPKVTAVTIELSNGTTVAASVKGGFFVAWWPTQSAATRIAAVGASGEVIATLSNPPGFGLGH